MAQTRLLKAFLNFSKFRLNPQAIGIRRISRQQQYFFLIHLRDAGSTILIIFVAQLSRATNIIGSLILLVSLSPLFSQFSSTQAKGYSLPELQAKGSQQTFWRLLEELDYSLQSNCKVHEGTDEVDRDEQFLHIAALVKQFQRSQVS
ncbi:MAG: hypothetical protein DCF20_19845 [Pseudanabaena sp.]|nr:MAG: hypothetical protein DCF20_19845 [Pseudanabaena sp.]